MKQKENKKRTYVTPQAELIGLDHSSPLLQFSGGHNDAGNDNDPLHAPRFDDFPDEEEDEESL